MQKHLFFPGWCRSHSSSHRITWYNSASLLAATAAITAFSPGCHSSRSSRHALFSPLGAYPMDTGVMQQWTPLLPRWSTNIPKLHATHDQARPPDAHAQGYKWSQLLHSHYLQNMGQESLKTPSRLICSFPTPCEGPGFDLWSGNQDSTCRRAAAKSVHN